MDSVSKVKSSLLQGPFPADLVEIGLRNRKSVFCVAQENTKVFLAFKLAQEVNRKSFNGGEIIIIVTETNSDFFKDKFIQAIELQSSMKFKMVFSSAPHNKVEKDVFFDVDIFITSPSYLKYLIQSKFITWSNISMIIINDCHLAIRLSYPLYDIMDHLKSFSYGPIVVGLTSVLPLNRPSQLVNLLKEMESVFGCNCSVSSDLVALNQYGEQPRENVIVYSESQANDERSNFVSSTITNLLKYLTELCQCDEKSFPKSVQVTNLCSMFKSHYDIFKRLGADAATYNAKTILQEMNKMQKKTRNEIDPSVLSHCKDQLKEILENYSANIDDSNWTEIVSELISHLWIIKLQAENMSDVETGISEISTVNMKEKGSFLEHLEKYNLDYNPNKLQLSVILCHTNHEASALNFLLNKIAKQTPKLACIKSAVISSSNVRQNDFSALDTEDIDSQAVLQLVSEGEVNVLILCSDIEGEIHISSCAQLVRFGIPQDYLSFVKSKKIPRTSNAEVVFMLTDENDGKHLLKMFTEIESILAKHCDPCKFSLKDDEFWEESTTLDSNGQDLSLNQAMSAVALVNRYCQSFPKDVLSSAYPRFHAQVIDGDDNVRVVSRLYLPRHSPISRPFESFQDIAKDNATPQRIANAQCESYIAAVVLACKALHDSGEFEQQFRGLKVDNFTFYKADEKCSTEVADSNQGNEGSSKRRRAYERKCPSILMNNLCVAGTISYLYQISIKLSQANPPGGDGCTEDYVSSNMLGLLSRNRLPKVPNFTIFNKATELIVSITECANTVTLTAEELDLIQHFHKFMHTNIMNINGESKEECFSFDPESQTYGFYIVTLNEKSEVCNLEDSYEKDEEIACQKTENCNLKLKSCSDKLSLQAMNIGEENIIETNTLQAATFHPGRGDGSGSVPIWHSKDFNLGKNDTKACQSDPTSDVTSCVRDHQVLSPTLALDFLKYIEQELVNLASPIESPTCKQNNFEAFRGRIVTATYMAKPMKYIVEDIRYDMSPLTEFPDPLAAATFSDYYKQRYDINVHANQPLLLVRHLSKMVKSLVSKYRDSKGQFLTLPTKNSSRQKKSQTFLIPELCSIHPITATLWRDVLHIPSILYRLEGILLAEELRQKIAAETKVGSIKWPDDAELPQVAFGTNVGEKDSLAESNIPDITTVPHHSLKENYDAIEIPQKNAEETFKSPTPSVFLHKSTVLEESNEKQHKKSDILETSSQVMEAASHCGPKQSQVLESKQIEKALSRKIQQQPSSTLILKALTCNGAMDVFNHDRLEVFGDSFIKYAVSLNMYRESPLVNVAKLSFYRGLRVSNRQLYYLGRAFNIPSYMFNISFQPLVTWCPHGFKVLKSNTSQDGRLKLISTYQEMDLSDIEDEKCGEEIVANSQLKSSVEIEGHKHLVASDKTVADTVEAIIGAYLVTNGVKGAFEIMKWIGLPVKDNLFSGSNCFLWSTNQKCDKVSNNHEEQSNAGSLTHLELEFEDVETTINYSFDNKLLLLQAFTHSSYPRDLNQIPTCYEQLEFLGDALLDILVTRYLYFTFQSMSPGALTDMRAAVVNSYSFAFLSTQLGFHKHLRSISPSAFRVTNKFIALQNDAIKKKMMTNPDQIFSTVFVPPDEDGDTEGIEVPKILADLFESVIGAVFIDSGMDLERTWLVVYQLLKSTFDHYANNPPISPIRQLQEMFSNNVSFTHSDRTITGRYSCAVAVKGHGKFKGTGRSLKIARSIAAQRALAHIASKKEKEAKN